MSTRTATSTGLVSSAQPIGIPTHRTRTNRRGFQGMPRDEAWTLIEELAEHSTRDQFIYYHQWRVGDVLMWDELATMHRGAGDYRPDERRVLLRTIVYSK